MTMSNFDKSLSAHKIDRKWVREEKRIFSEYPKFSCIDIFGEENWLELLKFYRDDIKWLLALDHHKFWSHMIYSEKVQELLISFLKESPSIFLKKNFLVREDMKNLFSEVEHLIFLVFLRLSTEKESESCFIKNFGDIIYNNYLFTVPIILDICLIYGSSNLELVKKMINNVITAAPEFLDDFQEIIPQFIYVLKTVKEKLLVKREAMLEGKSDMKSKEVFDLVLYFYDAVATVQIFFELYSNICQLFSKGELINEIVYFYSNVLPEMFDYWSKNHSKENSLVYSLIENSRIDLLKIIKSVFDFVLNESTKVIEENEEVVNLYLDLMMKLLSEPTFFFDYNLIYSVEFELEYAVRNCQNVDSLKINQILDIVRSVNGDNSCVRDNIFEYPDDSGVKVNSLVTEVKDIFPHLEENFIKQCLNYYNYNTEKVIAVVLENHIQSDLSQISKPTENEMLEFRGKHKNKHENFNKILDDRKEINKMKERYKQLSFVVDEMYDDEYDDTYNENIDISLREGDEMMRRPFVVPRILRSIKCDDDDDDDDDDDGNDDDEDDDDDDDGDNGDDYDDDDDGDGDDVSDGGSEEEEEERKDDVRREEGIEKKRTESSGKKVIRRDIFTENPATVREELQKKKSSAVRRVGRQSQSRQVLRNREFKRSHKSLIANHNRKVLAAKKT